MTSFGWVSHCHYAFHAVPLLTSPLPYGPENFCHIYSTFCAIEASGKGRPYGEKEERLWERECAEYWRGAFV